MKKSANVLVRSSRKKYKLPTGALMKINFRLNRWFYTKDIEYVITASKYYVHRRCDYYPSDVTGYWLVGCTNYPKRYQLVYFLSNDKCAYVSVDWLQLAVS